MATVTGAPAVWATRINRPVESGRAAYLFDQYEYADKSGTNFYDRYMKGEKMKTGWVNDSDFEK